MPALDRLRGRHAAGFLAYEAGHALEPKLAPLAAEADPERAAPLWFGLFDGWEEVDPQALLPDPAGAWAARPRPLVERPAHEAAVERALEHILAGDIYQANLTFPAEVATAGHPLALYAAIRPRARAGWGGVVFTGAHWLLSFSPELFFTLEAGRVTARPMKGTAPAASDPEALRNDPKQRAENLMIVDLLRNDLSRLSQAGQRQGAGPVRGRDLSDLAPADLDRDRRARGRARRSRPSRDHLPVRIGDRRAQDPGDGDHRVPGAGSAGPLYRKYRQACAGRRGRVQCRDPDPGPAGRRDGRPAGPRLRDRRRQRRGGRMARMPGEGRVCGDDRAVRPHRDDALRSERRPVRARPPSGADEAKRRRLRLRLRPPPCPQRAPGGDLLPSGGPQASAAAVEQRRAGDRIAADSGGARRGGRGAGAASGRGRAISG